MAMGSGASGMSGGGAGELPERARVFTVAAWVMLPMFLVSVALGGIVGKLLLTAVDLKEGQLLGEAGGIGWLLLAVTLLIAVAPLIAGIGLARKALGEGAGTSAKVSMGVNGLLLVLFAGSSLAQQIIHS